MSLQEARVCNLELRHNSGRNTEIFVVLYARDAAGNPWRAPTGMRLRAPLNPGPAGGSVWRVFSG
jgi:hypothetical protein